MVRNQETQCINAIDGNTKVIDEIFAVEEVVGCKEEIPGERSEPGQSMDSVNAITD